MDRDFDPSRVIKRLNQNNTLLDILIEMEDFLDSLDLYAFKNWIDGEVVDGPMVSRYWCEFTLKYPYSKMPDPKGALRLTAHDVKISFVESTELSPIRIQNPSDYQDGTHKPKLEHVRIWLVTVKIPRRFIDDIIDQSIEMYDTEVDLEDAQDAQDAGLDSVVDRGEMDQEQEQEDAQNEDFDL